ncbi:MAG: hypothetical protein F2840_02490 [Actinobacteria bacterium]|jgi:hypothetical protein|uniref:Unannotated protein n=1 Tax=freshwater metagenome TaxID=449393 RepID=A0A6J7IVK3_9ZZZZ|nr:hypothetical protein [Actinomycetota bacterium]
MSVAESAPTATQPFSVGGSISFGWRMTWKNFWRLLLVVIVFFVINAVLSAISGAGTTSSIDLSNPDTLTADQLWETGNLALSFIGSVVQSLASFFLGLGVIRIALAVTRGEKVELGKVFSFAGYGRYLIGSIFVGIIVVIGLLIGIVPGVVIAASTDSIVWAAVGAAVGIVLAIALSLAFTFFGYLILDRDARGLSSLGASWKLVKPHFGALLGLYILIGIISFGLLVAAMVLGTLMLVVGLLITLPVAGVVIFGMSALSVAYAYRTIAGEPVAS